MINNIILDTDMSNEIDDQFALTYLLKSLNNYNLECITIAPFENSGYAKTKNIKDGLELSYKTTLNILDMLNKEEYKNVVFKGAVAWFNNSKELNSASHKIIEIALKNEMTTIIAIGAITNVALAIYHEPRIKNRIKVIWLGGNSFLSVKNDEFNFRQDVDAVRYVFNSGVDLTVIPCRNVASNLGTTIYELEHYLKDKGEIGSYLCEIFKDCKKAYMKDKIDEVGQSKTLWDISAIAYLINPKWFDTCKVYVPTINEDTSYTLNNEGNMITFINDLRRNKIFQDFFLKMGCKYD